MGNIANGTINTFVDGDVVSANGTAPALLRSALNPKMEVIRAAVNDNDSRITIVEGQLASIGTSSVYNVKAAPFNAVGNGIVDDTAAIQLAITTAVANQGVVVFPTGTYKITDTLNITGTCAIVTDGASTSVIINQTVNYKDIFNITSSNVSISDLRLVNLAIPGNTFISVYGSSVSAYVSNVQIERCTFSYTAPSYSGNFIYLSFVDKVTIAGCTFGGGSYAAGSVGINALSIKNSLITRNTFSTYLSVGIQLSRVVGTSLASYPACDNVVIVQNNFTQIASLCVAMLTVTNIYISGNTFRNTVGANPASNSCYATIKATASLDPSSVPLPNYYITITENYIDNSSSAPGWIGSVYLSRTYDSIISNNIFAGNGLASQSTTATTGEGVIGNLFLESTCSNVNVVGCTFIRPYFGGAVLGGLLFSPPFDTNTAIIANNVFIDVYTPIGYSFRASGIVQLGTSTISVSGNVLRRGSLASSASIDINSYGFYNFGFSETFSGSGAFINMASNDFTLAQVDPIKTETGTAIVIYYTEPTGDRVFKGFSSAPSTGTWRRGDKVLVDNPSASGYIGYVCTTAGTPGTWKGYGTIQA